jgi:hypothetical protein
MHQFVRWAADPHQFLILRFSLEGINMKVQIRRSAKFRLRESQAHCRFSPEREFPLLSGAAYTLESLAFNSASFSRLPLHVP